MKPAALLSCIVFLAMAMLVSSCTEGFPPEFPVPEFELESPLTGVKISNTTIAGKPAIIYWFTSW